MKKNTAIYMGLAMLFASVGNAQAAGFALIEQSGSGMGNAFAGAAASVEDASTIYFNPAGMSYLPENQLVIAAHAIRPSAEFSNNGTTSVLGTAVTGGNGGDAGDLAFLPNIYFAKSISE
jgi:long-chain fatty acid transport protein